MVRKLGSCLALAVLGTSACASGPTGDAQSPDSTATAGATTSTPASTTPATTTSTTPSPPSSTTTTPATTTSTTTTTAPSTTTTTVPPVRRIGSAGDSLMLGMIPPFQRALGVSGYDFQAQWFTGFLAARDQPYWDQVLADLPDVLIVLFAPWELAALNRGDLDLSDPTWTDRYLREFVEPAIARLREAGTPVVWLAMPPSNDPVETMQYAFLNAIWRDVVDAEATMTWLETAPLLAGPDGGFLGVDETVTPPVRLFQTDGRHLCPEGGRRLTAGVLDLLETEFGVTVDPSWVDTDWAGNTAAYDLDQCRVG